MICGFQWPVDRGLTSNEVWAGAWHVGPGFQWHVGRGLASNKTWLPMACGGLAYDMWLPIAIRTEAWLPIKCRERPGKRWFVGLQWHMGLTSNDVPAEIWLPMICGFQRFVHGLHMYRCTVHTNEAAPGHKFSDYQSIWYLDGPKTVTIFLTRREANVLCWATHFIGMHGCLPARGLMSKKW